MNALIATAFIFWSAVSVWAGSIPLSYATPDGALKAIIVPTGRLAGAKEIENGSDKGDPLEYECRIEIRNAKGRKVWSEDFGSPDHDHGRGVAFASWSPNGNYFVFSTVSSGGHHPWQFFTYAYSRRDNDLYLLDPMVGEVVEPQFALTAPDRISLTVFDRSAKEKDGRMPSKKVTVGLSKLLLHQKPTSKRIRLNPPLYSPY
jgi:hypothetical protein